MEAAALEVAAKAHKPKQGSSSEAYGAADAAAQPDAARFLQKLQELKDRATRLKDAENEKLQTRVHELFTERLVQVDLISGDTDLEALRAELYEQARAERAEDSDARGDARGDIEKAMINASGAVKRAAEAGREARDAIYELERVLDALEQPESARKRKRR